MLLHPVVLCPAWFNATKRVRATLLREQHHPAGDASMMKLALLRQPHPNIALALLFVFCFSILPCLVFAIISPASW